jgi:hypothetical protein
MNRHIYLPPGEHVFRNKAGESTCSRNEGPGGTLQHTTKAPRLILQQQQHCGSSQIEKNVLTECRNTHSYPSMLDKTCSYKEQMRPGEILLQANCTLNSRDQTDRAMEEVLHH